MIDPHGEWDGVCACGKKELDGVKCILGATHKQRHVMPWENTSTVATTAEEPSYPWTQQRLPWE